ncbi:MAG: zinc ABC transporter substrate-binding protein ZnuA [Halopseudomonas sp.]|uniref:zinc ABC transporter substrate-binding protein ZnuA n=1 Tax=Halopseudomonas sp. TaxID=2901191 RepID=UPI003001E801
MLFRRLLVLSIGLLLSTTALADSKVLTSIKPVQQISAALLAGIDEPAVLLPPGASPHVFALRPSDRRALASAERIYWIGPSLERFLVEVLHERDSARELIHVPGLSLREFDEAHDHQHETEEAHADHADEHGDEHAHEQGHEHDDSNLDPHIWLSPENALTIARWMRDDLAPLYPEQQARLDSNLAAFEQSITALEQSLQQRFAPLSDKPYFVFHDGYDYLEAYLGIAHRGVFSLAHEIQPGARHVNELRQTLSAAAPACVFSEPQFTPRLVRSLTEGLQVKSAQLDPLGSDIKVGPQGYEQQLRELTDTLAGCLESL